MKLARAGLSGKLGQCPACGMEVAESKAKAEGRTAQRDGKTFYFCSNECMTQFKIDKEQSAKTASVSPEIGHHDHSHVPAEGMPSAQSEKKFDQCPVCSMTVVVSKAKALGRQLEHLGHNYYFCSDTCKKRFAARPGPAPAREQDAVSSLKTDAPLSKASGQTAERTEPEHAMSMRPPSGPLKDNAEEPADARGTNPSGDHSASTGERDASGLKTEDPHAMHGGSSGMPAPAKKHAEFDLKRIW